MGGRRLWGGVDLTAMACTESHPLFLLPSQLLFLLGLEQATEESHCKTEDLSMSKGI